MIVFDASTSRDFSGVEKDHLNNSLNSAKAAISEGIVPGGGD